MTESGLAAATTYQNILVDIQPPTAIITNNRPRSLNALSHQTFAEISRALDELAANAEVRVLIVTGSGNKAFASGADIGELEAFDSAEDGFEHSRASHQLLFKFHELDKPIICAVNGYALGGGCELAMAGDIVIAAESASFGQPEVNLGIIPGFGGTQRLPRLVGRHKALELIFTGDRITSREALEIGLVNRVVPDDDLMDTALALASKIAEKAPRAIALAKRAVYQGLEVGPRAGNEAEMTYFGLAVGTADRQEGTSAFLAKRKPVWQGK